MLSEHGCKIAPNTYWVAKKRPPSTRSIRDAELVVEIGRVYAENLFVYGPTKSGRNSTVKAFAWRVAPWSV